MIFYEWTGKGPYFQNIQRKKFEKITLSRVLNPLQQNHILARVVDFFIAGHTYTLQQVLKAHDRSEL